MVAAGLAAMARRMLGSSSPNSIMQASAPSPSPVIVDQQLRAAAAPRTIDDLLDYTELHPAMQLDSLSSMSSEARADIVTRLAQLNPAAPAGSGGHAPGIQARHATGLRRLAYAGRALECPEALFVLHYDVTAEFRRRRSGGSGQQAQPGLVTGSPALLTPSHVEAAQLWAGSSTLLLAYCVLQTWPYRSAKYAVIDSIDTVVGGLNLGQVLYVKARAAVNAGAQAEAGVPSQQQLLLQHQQQVSTASFAQRQPAAVPLFPRAPTNIYYWLKVGRA